MKFSTLSLSLAALCAATPAMIQAQDYNPDQPENALMLIESTQDPTSYAFTYNDKGLVTLEDAVTNMYYHRTFQYDEEGRMTLLTFHQKLGQTFTAVYSYKFEYDDEGRLLRRLALNLDSDTGKMDCTGLLYYMYNSLGHLDQIQYYWDEAMKDLFMVVKYDLDYTGRINKEEEYRVSPFPGEGLIVYRYCDYTYDSEGRLESQTYYDRNPDTLEETCTNMEFFRYDDAGNCVEIVASEGMYDIRTRNYISYMDKVPKENVIYPDIPVDTQNNRLYSLGKNAIYEIEIHEMNYDTRKLEYKTNFIYHYNVNPKGGVKTLQGEMNNPMASPIAVCQNGELNVVGAGIGENVAIYNMNGKTEYSGTYNGAINVNHLPAGVYIVKTGNGVTKFTK